MFIFKRIKQLEDDVSKLKAENEKLHRIIKHAGSEPVAYIEQYTSIHRIIDPYNASLYYKYTSYYKYTLYYYKDNTEYSVELDDAPNDLIDFRIIKILKDVNGVVYLDCIASVHVTKFNNECHFPTLNTVPERFIIVFDYFFSKYEIHKICDDLIKVYKDLEFLNEEKEETNNQ